MVGSRYTKGLDHRRMSSSQLSRSQSHLSNERGSVLERTKLQRTPVTRYSRHYARYLKPQQTELRLRTSLADLIMKELEAYDRCIFYQRVYILAKNVALNVTSESSISSMLSKYMRSKTSLTSAGLDPEEPIQEEFGESSEMEYDEISQAQAQVQAQVPPKTDMDNVSNVEKKEPLLMITRKDLESKEKRTREMDFFDEFKEKLAAIITKCEAEQLSEDRFTGLFLCMGNSHSLFVLEGTEDTIAIFCREILDISSTYFEALRVFLVEDRIEDAYFDEFAYRRSVAMNINEKFPPPTANDPQLMAAQHWIIKEKLRVLCETLSQELRPDLRKVGIQFDATPVEGQLPHTAPALEEEKKPPKRKLRRKRKKRPKSPETAVEALNKVETNVDRRSSNSQSKDDLEADELDVSVQSILPVEQEEVEPVEDGIKKERTNLSLAPEIGKEVDLPSYREPSVVRLQSTATILGTEPDIPEEIEEEEVFEIKDILRPYSMNPSIYNRLLPEIQRIELVLSSKRFYFDLEQFLPFSQEIPMQPDEDALTWPTIFNYLPLNVFERLPYDVNLSFGDYNLKQNEEDDSDSSEHGEEKEQEEDEKGEQDEKKEA